MQCAAVITIHRAGDMSPEGRKQVADWLRLQAAWLEEEGEDYSERYRARYLYLDKK